MSPSPPTTLESDSTSTFGIHPEVYQRRRAILAVLCLSLVLIVVAVSSLNVALPTIQQALGASPTELQWILDAYALVFAGFLLPAGALGDRFGRKGALQVGLVIFGVSAAVGSQVTSAGALIAVRAVMGIGAALVMPATLSIIQSSFPPHERAKAVATWAAFAGAGAALGPPLSGLILETNWWWGAVFIVNLPLVVLLLGLSIRIVPTSKDPEGHALDPVGAVLSVFALVTLVFGIIEGPEWGWTDPRVLAAFGAAVLFGAAFVAWELRVDAPTLDPRLFRLPGFSMGSMSITFTFFCMFGMFFLVTLYLQYVKGYTPLQAGVSGLPSAAMMIAISPRSPAITARLGIRTTLRVGYTLAALGFLQLASLDPSSPYWRVGLAFVFTGSGIALVMPPSTSSIISALPLSKAGVGSAVNDVTREVGGALGIAVLGSVLNSLYTARVDLEGVRALVPPAGRPRFEAAATAITSGIGPAEGVARTVASEDFPGAAQLAEAIRTAARSAFSGAMTVAFLVAAGVVVVAAIVVTRFIPDRVEMG